MTTRNTKPETIALRTWNSSQSVHHLWTFRETDPMNTAQKFSHTFRIRIRVDASVPAQSFAHIERWNGSEWRAVASLPVQEMRCAKPGKHGAPIVNVYAPRPEYDETDFVADCGALRGEARAICGLDTNDAKRRRVRVSVPPNTKRADEERAQA